MDSYFKSQRNHLSNTWLDQIVVKKIEIYPWEASASGHVKLDTSNDLIWTP